MTDHDSMSTDPSGGQQLRPGAGCGMALAASIAGGLFAAALTAGLLFAAFGLPGEWGASEPDGSPAAEAPGAPSVIEVTGGDAGYVEAVAAKVLPSVVSIGIQQSGIDPFTGRRVTQTVGNGSGVIIRADGYIITNNHVVSGADNITVSLGVEELPATLVGADPSSDLAVVRIQRTGLPAIELGSSASLAVGQPVVAVGSPFGLDQSVTSGIVSALGRTSFMESAEAQLTAYTSLIQTDAAINPGNSGGALVDARGRLIGINTLIQTGSQGVAQSAGVGFAIPVDYAVKIAEELIETGRASHPYMGVSTITISAAIAAEYALPVEAGAIVERVVPGSPAEAGGIERGDIIVSIAGEDVASVEDVFAAIRTQSIGEEVDVVVYRGEDRVTLAVTLGSDQVRR